MRKRKLLLHKQEIRKLIGRTVEKGLTLVPLKMYFKSGKVKMTIGLARGKKSHDKRETMKKREADRETRAAVKERQR
jgi:SsrA-binding protein